MGHTITLGQFSWDNVLAPAHQHIVDRRTSDQRCCAGPGLQDCLAARVNAPHCHRGGFDGLVTVLYLDPGSPSPRRPGRGSGQLARAGGKRPARSGPNTVPHGVTAQPNQARNTAVIDRSGGGWANCSGLGILNSFRQTALPSPPKT